MAEGIFCKDCGASIDQESNDPARREPCPLCGSFARQAHLEAISVVSVRGGATATVIPYAETLLAKAHELIARGDFSIAVVVTHMACEIAAERAISQAFAEKSIEYLEQSVLEFLSGYNLATKRIRNLYNAVTGKRIQDQPFWQAFTESAARRNDTVHGGTIVTKQEAEESYKATSRLVEYLK